MCKVGDIILIERYKARGKTLRRHSFVVTVIGNIQPDILELVLEFIDTSDFEAEAIIDNL